MFHPLSLSGVDQEAQPVEAGQVEGAEHGATVHASASKGDPFLRRDPREHVVLSAERRRDRFVRLPVGAQQLGLEAARPRELVAPVEGESELSEASEPSAVTRRLEVRPEEVEGRHARAPALRVRLDDLVLSVPEVLSTELRHVGPHRSPVADVEGLRCHLEASQARRAFPEGPEDRLSLRRRDRSPDEQEGMCVRMPAVDLAPRDLVTRDRTAPSQRIASTVERTTLTEPPNPSLERVEDVAQVVGAAVPERLRHQKHGPASLDPRVDARPHLSRADRLNLRRAHGARPDRAARLEVPEEGCPSGRRGADLDLMAVPLQDTVTAVEAMVPADRRTGDRLQLPLDRGIERRDDLTRTLIHEPRP